MAKKTKSKKTKGKIKAAKAKATRTAKTTKTTAARKTVKAAKATKTIKSDWLSSPQNPAVQYLVARDLASPAATKKELETLKSAIFKWAPVRKILALQNKDGSFRSLEKNPTSMPTYRALCYLHRCGLDMTDEPVAKAVDFLADYHCSEGAVSHNRGGSGVLPCYVGMLLRPVIEMGGLSHPLVKTSLQWVVDHQRFDHKKTRAGGDKEWPFRAVVRYGCWKSVSCYHGVAGTMRALSAVPPRRRSKEMKERLQSGIEYFRIHRAYKKSVSDTPLFRHMTQFFLTGGYRFHLIDVLEAIADADAKLVREGWVREAVDAVDALTAEGRIVLSKNYSNELIEPLPLEPTGKPSRFLTYQWRRVKRKFGVA